MSNMQAPTFLSARQSRNVSAGAMHGIGGASPPRVSLTANKFTFVDGAGNSRVHTMAMLNPQTNQMQEFLAPYLDCVLVGVNANVSKVYYDTKYDPNADDLPPACWSDNGVGPSIQSARPQSPTCVMCPHNVWGSAVSEMTGKQTKACNDAKKIAIIIPGDPIVYQLRIPPATLKNLKQYAQTVQGQQIGAHPHTRPADLSDIITRVSFESQGVLKFEPVAFIDEQIDHQMNSITQEKLDNVLGTLDTPISEAAFGKPQVAAPQIQHAAQHFAAPQLPQPWQQPAAPQAPQQPYQPAPQQAMTPPAPVGAPVAFAPQPATGAPSPTPPAAKTRSRRTAAPVAPQAPAQAPAMIQGPPAMMVAPQQPQQPQAPQQWPQPAAAAPQFLQPQQGATPTAPPAQQWTPPGVQAAAPAQPPGTQFGIVQNPAAPTPDLSRALDAAMNFGK